MASGLQILKKFLEDFFLVQVFIFPFQELARRHLAVSMGGCRDST
jgi:hypothetical protein